VNSISINEVLETESVKNKHFIVMSSLAILQRRQTEIMKNERKQRKITYLIHGAGYSFKS
jgi:hypothetical protein